MDWLQAGTFLIQPTKQNIPVIEMYTHLDEPKPTALIYNPQQEHALLFRNEEVGIVLDYLNPKSLALFNKAKEVAVCEMDPKTQQVRYYYRLPIRRVKDKLNIQLMMKKVA